MKDTIDRFTVHCKDCDKEVTLPRFGDNQLAVIVEHRPDRHDFHTAKVPDGRDVWVTKDGTLFVEAE